MICTFYSYKGGVGRSMAVANTGDIFARAGLRVLMIDFDLEAPGLEQYFPVDQTSVRAHAGLFDLIQRYKSAMASSVPTTLQEQDFRRLQDLFIIPIYPRLPSEGKLHLMSAGRREGDEQLSEYALNLRQFDWQDFYFNFGGEVFFEWLRRTLDQNLYDVVLIDSRTGVTEMGGICAYQLADVVLVMCASNQQNLDGTHDVVRNFFSPRVTRLRGGRRAVQLLVVPSRVETRDETLLSDFRDRFEKVFARFTPQELTEAGLTYWDLMIPYEPRSAFQERVVTHGSRAGARSAISPVMQKLVRAIALLATPPAAVCRLAGADSLDASEAPEAQYDLTTRAAGFDVFLAYCAPDGGAAHTIAQALVRKGLRAFIHAEQTVSVGEAFQAVERKALDQSGLCAIIVGPSMDYPWRSEYLRALLEDRDRGSSLRFLPVLLPGATLPTGDVVPSFLAGLQWLRLTGLDSEVELDRLVAAIGLGNQTRAKTEWVGSVTPYKGLLPFSEADAPIFFGRADLVDRIVQHLEDSRFLALIGSSGIGKTSVICAGVIPKLRHGAILGSEHWHYVVMRPGGTPVRALFDALALVTSDAAPIPPDEMLVSVNLGRYFERSDARYLLFIDQFEELNAEANEFIRLLLDILTHWKSRIALVVAMRSDHVGRILEVSPAWAGLVESNIVFVAPMNTAELRLAIEAPAKSAGLALEAGLTDLILRDAVGAAGALPLLQYVLRALWERRQHGYLTVAAYHELGGVEGSLARDAEAFFHRLPPEDHEKAMAILLRLVAVAPDGAFVRRPATLEELMSVGPANDIRRILDGLVAARLVVVSSGSEGLNVIADLAHDAVIRAWPRFREQIEQVSQFLRLRTRLGTAAARWQETDRRRGFLYPEGEIRLLRSQGLLERYWNELSPSERAFIEASERALRIRGIRVGAAVASLTVLLLAATSLAIYAYKAREVAERQSVNAKVQLRIAEEQRELANMQRALAEREVEIAHLANLRATSAISPDGMSMLRIASNGRASIIDLRTGREIGPIKGDSEGITAATFSPDGRRLAVATNSKALVSIYDSATLKQVASLSGHEDTIRRLAFSPDGRLIASGSDDASARIWSLEGRILVTMKTDGPVVGVAFSPDGSRLTILSAEGTLYVVDPNTGRIVRQ